MQSSSPARREESLQCQPDQHQFGMPPIEDPSSAKIQEELLPNELDQSQSNLPSIEDPLSSNNDQNQPSIQPCYENDTTMEINCNETSPNIPHQDVPAVFLQGTESVPTIPLLKNKIKKSDKKIEMLKKKLKLSQQRSRRLQKMFFH
jgi:hypothetical protein